MTIYGDKDPWEVPAYTLPVASRLVRVPVATLRYWSVGGRRLGPNGEERLSQPLIRLASGDSRLRRFSYTNLVEAHVLASMRRRHEISMPKVRQALSYVEEQLGEARPLFSQRFQTDGQRLFVEQMRDLVDVNTGEVVDEGLRQGFTRIQYEDGLALQFFPYPEEVEFGDGTDPNLEQPRGVTVDPRLAFGRPVVPGTGLAAEEVWERFRAGDVIADLMTEFGLTHAQVEEAIRAGTLMSREAA